ncbi:MAG: beta-glucosidase, partial [Clostridia bacterium]|nr:beta-glucosidase [Clostridia bacterium]
MKLKKTISAILAAAMTVSAAAIPVFANEEETAVYLDTTKTFEERAADLVSRMTLEEKVAQLSYSAPAIDRLGVKKYNYWMECLHGVARQGKATNYPASLSLSNTWNRELIHTIADETSTEARAKNNRYNLSYYTPTINMARDPRWGRNEETYGEDPYLTGQLGAAFVKGMQGDDEKYTKIIATIKHFAANNNEKNRRG